MLGERTSTLELEPRLRAPRDRMEEDRLLDRAHERVPDPAEKRMEGQTVRSYFPVEASAETYELRCVSA